MLSNAHQFDDQIKNLGLLLLMVGILTLAAIALSESFIYTGGCSFAVIIAGIISIRKKATVAPLLGWIAAVGIPLIIGYASIYLLLLPPDFVISYIKLKPLDALTTVAPTGIFLATILYAFFKLKNLNTRMDVLEYKNEILNQLLNDKPKAFFSLILSRHAKSLEFIRKKLNISFDWFWGIKGGFSLGIILMTLILSIPLIMHQSFQNTFNEASSLAKEKIQGNYRYAVTGIDTKHGITFATVYAYNKDQLKKIEVNWKIDATRN